LQCTELQVTLNTNFKTSNINVAITEAKLREHTYVHTAHMHIMNGKQVSDGNSTCK